MVGHYWSIGWQFGRTGLRMVAQCEVGETVGRVGVKLVKENLRHLRMWPLSSALLPGRNQSGEDNHVNCATAPP